MDKVRRSLSILLFIALFTGCSINQFAVRTVGNMLSSGQQSAVFSGEEDPELIGDALPFTLKLYEILLEGDPQNAALALATGRAFVSYSSAWVQTPADELPPDQFDLQVSMHARAKKLFLRGREYILHALEIRSPGFRAALDRSDPSAALALLKREDIDYLYWAGVSWLAAFSADPFDFSIMVTLPRAITLLNQVEAWDDGYDNGSLHEIFVSFYGSAPADLGGSEDKSRQNFLRAVELSRGLRAGPYVALAATVCVKTQKLQEFRDLLSKALAIDVDQNAADRLINIINQRKAKWLLDHADNFFLEAEGGP